MPKGKAAATTPGSGKKVQLSLTSYFTRAPATPSTSAKPVVKAEPPNDDDDFCIDFAMDDEKPVEVKSTGQLLQKPPSTPVTPQSPSVTSLSSGSTRNVKTKENKLPKKGLTENSAKRVKRDIPDSPDDVQDDSDNDPDFKDDGEAEWPESDDEEVLPEDISIEEEQSEADESVEFATPKKRKLATHGSKRSKTAPSARLRASAAKKTRPSTAASRNNVTKTKTPLNNDDDEEDSREAADDDVVVKHTHETLSWLHRDKIRDKSGVLHKDLIAQGLTPRTLMVPKDLKTTPALEQWWKLKSDNYDCILFFKLGKFYEMYHMDADVGVSELGIIYMKGDHAHCGFPEAAFSTYANKLVQKGYKVIRVEQTMSAAQFKQTKGKEKAFPREIIRILTPGTQSVSTLECETEKLNHSSTRESSCLLTICEKVHALADGSEESEYGVCVLYPGPGTFVIGQFKEDRYHSRLRTLLAHHPPNEIVLERGRVSTKLTDLLRSNTENIRKEFLLPLVEFLDAKSAVKMMLEREYFGPVLQTDWPQCLSHMLQLGGTLPTTKSESELAIRALGGCAWYLKRCEVDFDLISLKNFELYDPMETRSGPSTTAKRMILDGTTLINLDIVPNKNGDPDACLLRKINRCRTKFGTRLLKEWVISPLCRTADIVDRQDALADLASFRLESDKVFNSTLQTLKSLPDLERLLSKVHIVGSAKRKQIHPETRASMFEEKTYGKRKIKDFLATVAGFERMMALVRDISRCLSFSKSECLRKIVTITDNDIKVEGTFPNLQPVLDRFMKAFDPRQAEEDGKIKPKKGIDEVYEAAVREEKEMVERLEQHKVEMEKKFKCQIKFFHQARNRFQMEMPVSACQKMPEDFELKSTKKGFQRYWSAKSPKLLDQLVTAEEKREAAEKDATRRVFELFDDHYSEWIQAVRCMATLDVLLCLEEYSHNLSQSCRPIFKEVSEDQKAFMTIRDGRHPLVVTTFSGGDFIPNETYIGTGEPDDSFYNGSLTLVTGPNMGGKSTLMRQVGLIAILAQLGSNVPASYCEMTPVDRIFTRIGASDNLLAGESTFFVELSETSSILRHATSNSLVLIDELGRGTATFDGTAIAAAVLKDLVDRINCRILFSTHYHSLVDRFSGHPNIKLGHMACLVENENEEDPTKESITFLYKFIRGDCPKSYGFNAAKLAGLSDTIVKRAHELAARMEQLMNVGKQKRGNL